MTRTTSIALALAIASLATLVACSHPLERKLEGRWFGESVEGFDDAEIAIATGWVRGTSMEFSGSAITMTVPTEEPRSGRFRIDSAHEDSIVISVERQGASDRVRFILDDEHLMRWQLDDERSVVLRREQ